MIGDKVPSFDVGEAPRRSTSSLEPKVARFGFLGIVGKWTSIPLKNRRLGSQ
jgi:hypothetical protein